MFHNHGRFFALSRQESFSIYFGIKSLIKMYINDSVDYIYSDISSSSDIVIGLVETILPI